MDQNREIECIRQVLSGRTDLFAALVEAHQSGAYNLCCKILGNSEDARDCTQEAFIKAFEALRNFRLDSRFSTWLYRIVYNICISRLRKESRSFHLGPELSHNTESPVHNEGIGALNKEDMRMLLHEAYKALSPDEIFLVEQYYREEAAIEEIADMTGISPANVKIKLYRARQKMHQVIKSVLKEEIEVWNTK